MTVPFDSLQTGVQLETGFAFIIQIVQSCERLAPLPGTAACRRKLPILGPHIMGD